VCVCVCDVCVCEGKRRIMAKICEMERDMMISLLFFIVASCVCLCVCVCVCICEGKRQVLREIKRDTIV